MIAIASTALTLYIVCVGFSIFRAEQLADISVFLGALVLLQGAGTQALGNELLAWPALLYPIHWLAHRGLFREALRRAPAWLFALGFGAAAALAAAFTPLHSPPFIYFQF